MQDVWKSKIDARLALIIREHGFSEEMIVLSDMTAPDIATSREAFLENTTPGQLCYLLRTSVDKRIHHYFMNGT